MTNYKCYNCETPLLDPDPQSWFCNIKCKDEYWKKENVKKSKPKTLEQIQKSLKKMGDKMQSSDILAKLADNEEYFAAKNIFFPPENKIQGLNDD